MLHQTRSNLESKAASFQFESSIYMENFDFMTVFCPKVKNVGHKGGEF